MFSKLNAIINKIKNMNTTINEYQRDTVVQSLPIVAYINQAKRLIEDKEFDNAEIVLLRALDIENKNALIYKYLGKIYEQKRDYKKAIFHYDKSVKINSLDKDVWPRLGFCQLNINLLEDALVSFEKANQITPMNNDIYTGWGMTYMQMKKYALAKDKFNTAAKINKYNFSAILLSAVMETRLGEYKIAEEKLSFLVKTAPNESSFYEYANLLTKTEKYDKARIYAQKVIDLNSKMLPAYLLLAEIDSRLGLKDEAINQFLIALEMNLDCPNLHLEWAETYLNFFDWEKAKEQYLIYLNEEQNDVFVHVAINLCDVKLGNATSYTIDYNKEDNYIVHELLGIDLYKNNNFDEAIVEFQKANKLNSSYKYNLLNLARVYFAKKDIEKAKNYYELYTNSVCWDSNGVIEFAKVLIELSDFASAQRKLRKFSKVYPENVDILNLLFYTSYKLVKDNICDYNIKEAIDLANKILQDGKFEYNNEKQELEDLLKTIQGNK